MSQAGEPTPAGHAAVGWPDALALPEWLARLRWRASVAEAPPGAEAARPPLVLRSYPGAVALQGLELDATLVFELDELVRIELRGPLDALALAALGAGDETLDDWSHHRLTRGATRIAIDALDGLVALEPEDS